MKIIITILVSMFAFFCLNAQDTLTIFQCYDLATQNYEIGKNKALMEQITELKIKNAGINYLPKIDVNAQASYQSDATAVDLGEIPSTSPLAPLANTLPDADEFKNQYKVTLDISQIIYDGGITKASKAYEKIKLEADKQSIETDLYNVKDRINTLYFSILLSQEQEKALLLMRAELEERIQHLESGVRNGIVLLSNLQNVKAEKLKLDQNIDNVIQNKIILQQNLLFFIEYEDERDITFSVPEIIIYDSVQINRPEQHLFNLQAESLEVTKDVLKKSKNPKLIGFGQVGYGKPGINMLSPDLESYYIVGAKLSWNIWDWNKNKNERQMVSISQQQIMNQKEAFEKNIQLSVNQHLKDIERIELQIEKDEEIIQLRSEITKTAAAQLDNGTITSTDYLFVLNAETQARITLQTHIIQLKQAKINYLTSLGNI